MVSEHSQALRLGQLRLGCHPFQLSFDFALQARQFRMRSVTGTFRLNLNDVLNRTGSSRKYEQVLSPRKDHV